MKKRSSPENYILIGIPILFAIAAAVHFLYDLTGESDIIGALFPANESVWEHTKLFTVPFIMWWSAYYFIKGDKYNINPNKWFTAALVALLSATFCAVSLHYLYTGALGIESVPIDIIITFVAVGIGQLIGLHFFNYFVGVNYILIIVAFIALIVLNAVLTFNPPEFPIFEDSLTGKYGI